MSIPKKDEWTKVETPSARKREPAHEPHEPHQCRDCEGRDGLSICPDCGSLLCEGCVRGRTVCRGCFRPDKEEGR